jgi:hypothetical protein
VDKVFHAPGVKTDTNGYLNRLSDGVEHETATARRGSLSSWGPTALGQW